MNRLTGRFLRASRIVIPHRNFAGIPVDDKLMGLSDDLIELRDMVRKFLEKELEPVANEIDIKDNFPGMRDFWIKCGELGLHGITSPEVNSVLGKFDLFSTEYLKILDLKMETIVSVLAWCRYFDLYLDTLGVESESLISGSF